MKLKSKFLSSLVLSSALLFGNCNEGTWNTGNDAVGLIVANYIGGLVKSATTGNCAFSLNLGSLYAGAIFQGAAASTTNFTQTQYEAATGSSISTQGYSTYASVPFNKKYDAFLTLNGAWNETTRNTSLANQKASVDLAALVGGLAAYCSANGASLTTAGAVTSGTLQAVANNLFSTMFSSTEQATINAAINASFNAATGGLVTSWATYVSNATNGVGLANGSNASCNSIINSGNASSLNSVGNGVVNSVGSLSDTIATYSARLSWRSGIALLGCAKIPRSSCSFGAITTASRSADISSGITAFDSIMGNSDCRKANNNFQNSLLNQLFTGLPREIAVTGFNTLSSYYNVSSVGGSEGTLTSFQNNKILATNAYPKSAALQSLSQALSRAFPLKEGSTAYPVTTGTVSPTSQTAGTDATAPASGTIPWYGGSNLNISVVDSCASLGLIEVGPTPYKSTETSSASQSTRRPLSDVKEIIYAFSSNGTAASEYATLNGVSYTVATNAAGQATTGVASLNTTSTAGYNDAIACNRSFRKRTTIPAALNVGTTLADLNVPTGDGAATSLLTACVYGGTTGTTGTRATVASILSASLFGLAECPAAAQAGSSLFGEFGLQSYGTSGYPNGKD